MIIALVKIYMLASVNVTDLVRLFNIVETTISRIMRAFPPRLALRCAVQFSAFLYATLRYRLIGSSSNQSNDRFDESRAITTNRKCLINQSESGEHRRTPAEPHAHGAASCCPIRSDVENVAH